MAKGKFSIKEDLESRPLKQQVEILWISGPTYHNAKMIAKVLELPIKSVKQLVASL